MGRSSNSLKGDKKGRKPATAITASIKRKALQNPVQYIGFNETDRKDFVGGFHKRKVEKKRLKQEKVLARIKDEKRQVRRLKNDKLKVVMKQVDEIDAVTQAPLDAMMQNATEATLQEMGAQCHQTTLEQSDTITTITITELDMDDM